MVEQIAGLEEVKKEQSGVYKLRKVFKKTKDAVALLMMLQKWENNWYHRKLIP